jgi:dTDP-glucose pyrophosphorylase
MLAARDLLPSCLKTGTSLFDAIRALNGPAEGIAIITDAPGKVIGVLTDGDVRRAIMRESCLDASIDPYIRRDFISVSAADSRDLVLDLMQVRKIKHLPILDATGALIGIHLLHDVVGGEKLPNHAVIMAGGKGVRLLPITENIPKPMIQVAGRPILERLVLHLVGCGITRIHLSVNYLSEIIVNHFGDGERFGCEITYLHETEELGTGGALSLLTDIPEDPMVVLNGDLLTQIDFTHLLGYHADGGFAATMGFRPYAHQVPFGCLDLRDGRVLGIQEKPMLERPVNAGVYVISPHVLKLVPRRFFPITDLFQTLIDSGEPVGAYEITCDWADVGQHQDLSRARGVH